MVKFIYKYLTFPQKYLDKRFLEANFISYRLMIYIINADEACEVILLRSTYRSKEL